LLYHLRRSLRTLNEDTTVSLDAQRLVAKLAGDTEDELALAQRLALLQEEKRQRLDKY